MPNFVLPFITINISFILLFIASEIAYTLLQKYPRHETTFNTELIRKIVHLFTCILFIISTFYLPSLLFILLCIEALIALFISNILKIFKAAHNTREKKSNQGIYFFILGIIFLSLIFSIDTNVFRAALLILGISDSLASIFGIRFPIFNFSLFDNKSLTGSITFFLSTIVILGTTHIFLTTTLLVMFSLILTFIEALSYKGSDNFLVPLILLSFYKLNIYYSFYFLLILCIVSFIVYSVRKSKRKIVRIRKNANI